MSWGTSTWFAGKRRGGAVKPLSVRGLTQVKLLGAGSFGEVFSARDNKTGMMVVVKRLPRAKVSLLSAKREADLLKYMQPACQLYILCFERFQEDAQNYYILTEFLEDYVPLGQVARDPALTDERRAEITRNLYRGLQTIHSRDVAHRDLKPDNVLVSKNGSNIKFIDFGVSCAGFLCETRSMAGTPAFAAPEVYPYLSKLAPRAFTLDQMKRTDLWSLGLIIWELFAGGSTWKMWIDAADKYYAAKKPYVVEKFNRLPTDQQTRAKQQVFSKNFNYNNPKDILVAENRKVAQKMLALNLPGLSSLLNRDPNKRVLPRVGGSARAGGVVTADTRMRFRTRLPARAPRYLSEPSSAVIQNRLLQIH